MRKIFLLLLLTQLTFAQKPEQPEILYCFDFGGAFQRVAVGYTHISRVYHSPKYLWITNVQEINRSMEPDALLRDFMQLDEGEFRMGLDNGDYEIITFHYDIQEPHGPFDIYCQGQKVQSNISLVPGKKQQLSFNAVVKDEILKIKLKAKSGETFAINGLIVKGQSGRAAQSMFKNAPPDELPTVDEVLKNGNTDVEKRLKELCEWYMSHRLDNGFLGDFEPFNDKQMYWWYTTAFPIRTFLAAYDLFGDTRYMDATTDVLDKLVSEQLPNGAWHQTFRNKPTSRLTQTEIDSIKKNHWMNMADIGSIAGALGVACHYVSEPRKTKYINALRHFCDDWAMQWQKPSGGFTNGMEDGVPRTREYSSATGIEAGTFAFLYSVTRDKKYIDVANRAADFLLRNWNEDGRPICHAHHTEQIEPIYDQPITHFGASFYYIDGLLTVYFITENQEIKNKIEKVLGWYVKGEKGLLATMGTNSWWPLADAWDNSKTAGISLALTGYQQMRDDYTVDKTLTIVKRFLCTQEYAGRIGIMLEDAKLPWASKRLQTWSACSMTASGFAGLVLSEMVQPGIVYLKHFQN